MCVCEDGRARQSLGDSTEMAGTSGVDTGRHGCMLHVVGIYVERWTERTGLKRRSIGGGTRGCLARVIRGAGDLSSCQAMFAPLSVIRA